MKKVTEEQIKNTIKKHIETEKKRKIEEQEIINNGAMESIFNYLINIEGCQFVWNDEFSYYDKKDKDEKKLLGRQISIISDRVLEYFEKHNVVFRYETDNYFLTGFAIFKYKDTILYVEKISGQGTNIGIGIFDSIAKEEYNISYINQSEILDIEDILNGKEFTKTGSIYKDLSNEEIDKELIDLIEDYGIKKVKERLELLQKRG